MKKYFLWICWAVGALLMAFSVKNIYEPAELVTGGFLGLAIIGESCFDIPLWLSNVVLNIPLFVIAFRLEGKKIVLNTLLVTIMYSFIVGFLPEWDFIRDDLIISCILGGMLMGTGLGIILHTGASSGGVDLISIIVNHRNAKFSVAWIMFVIDAVIIVLGAVVFGWKKAVYSIVSVWIVSYVTGKILEPSPKLKKLLYIGKKGHDNLAE